MNIREAQEYLYSLGNEVETMKLGLDNIRKLLTALGSPEEKYLKVQVAGTNGKGSVCAFLNSICLEADIRTGMFTSPHLISITERVRIDGVDISEGEFARHATRVREVSESLVGRGVLETIPTFFEQITAIALLAFAEAGVELAILETGLGGRLDATTAANAEIAAITRIDIDHQKYLGETIQEIAAEKAAIIHTGSQVVIGEQEPAAMRLIQDHCSRLGIEPRLASETGRNPTGREGVHDAQPEETPSIWVGSLPVTSLGLYGKHQIENAKIAIVLARILEQHYAITDENIIAGLRSARHPGRLEFNGRFLFDGAHNIGGARALKTFLDEYVHRPVTMVFGTMNDKDVAEIATILFPVAAQVILARPNNSRALAPEQILEVIPDTIDVKKIGVSHDVAAALNEAEDVTPNDGLIVVTGSLYLIGEVKSVLKFEI